MDLFGISLDPSAVTQRHTLYDSDEDDENPKPQFTVEVCSPSPVNAVAVPLVITVGQPASVFVKSQFCLETCHPNNPVSFQTSSINIFKDQYFPSPAAVDGSGGQCTVTEVYPAQARNGGEAEVQFLIHNRDLKPENVNVWSGKVSLVCGYQLQVSPSRPRS